MACHEILWLENVFDPTQANLALPQNLRLHSALLTLLHSKLVLLQGFLPLGEWFKLMDLHLVQALLLELEELAL